MVAHAFNPSTPKAEVAGPPSSRATGLQNSRTVSATQRNLPQKQNTKKSLLNSGFKHDTVIIIFSMIPNKKDSDFFF